jgi:hypothetical protein
MQMLYNANLFSIYNIFTFPAFQQKFQSQKARRSEESDGESDTSESPDTLHNIIHLPFVSPARYPNKKNLWITYFCMLFNIDCTFNLTSSSYFISPSIVIIIHVHDTVFHLHYFFSLKGTNKSEKEMRKILPNLKVRWQNCIVYYLTV